jgi:hypothetical protein
MCAFLQTEFTEPRTDALAGWTEIESILLAVTEVTKLCLVAKSTAPRRNRGHALSGERVLPTPIPMSRPHRLKHSCSAEVVKCRSQKRLERHSSSPAGFKRGSREDVFDPGHQSLQYSRGARKASGALLRTARFESVPALLKAKLSSRPRLGRGGQEGTPLRVSASSGINCMQHSSILRKN